FLAQPAGLPEAFVDVVGAGGQRSLRDLSVLVLPRVVAEQVAFDPRGNLASRIAMAGRHRRIGTAEELVMQAAQQLPVMPTVARRHRPEQAWRNHREQRG